MRIRGAGRIARASVKALEDFGDITIDLACCLSILAAPPTIHMSHLIEPLEVNHCEAEMPTPDQNEAVT